MLCCRCVFIVVSTCCINDGQNLFQLNRNFKASLHLFSLVAKFILYTGQLAMLVVFTLFAHAILHILFVFVLLHKCNITFLYY